MTRRNRPLRCSFAALCAAKEQRKLVFVVAALAPGIDGVELEAASDCFAEHGGPGVAERMRAAGVPVEWVHAFQEFQAR